MGKGFLDTPIGTLEIIAENGKIIEINLKRLHIGSQTDIGQRRGDKTDICKESGRENYGKVSDYTSSSIDVVSYDSYCLADLEQIDKAKLQLAEYFAGKRKEFQLDIELRGTDFQKKVWQVLSQIPFGKTLSYSQVAEKVGNPKAQRAAGSAVGKNPLLIVVPCHRVIRTDGGLGGFSAGLENKVILQRIEGTGRDEKRGF